MIAMVLLGAATGAVVFGLLVWMRPPRPSPLVRLARFDAGRDTTTSDGRWDRSDSTETRSGGDRLGRWAAGMLARRGIASTGLRQDLALAGRSFEATMTRKVLLALFGFLLTLVTVAALQVAGGFDLPVGSGLLVGPPPPPRRCRGPPVSGPAGPWPCSGTPCTGPPAPAETNGRP